MMKPALPGTALFSMICLFFWAGGCATAPEAPIPKGKPVSVAFYQPPKKSQPHALHLRLINRSWVKGERPQIPSTKICPDDKMEKLLAGLAQLGFFQAARPGRGVEGGLAWLEVTGPEGSWVLDRPRPLGPQGRLPGESFPEAFKRFQQCCGLLLLLYNATFDLVPRDVPNGRDFFLKERKRVLEQQRKILRKKKSGVSTGGGR